MTGLERLRNVANAMRGYAVRGGGPLDLELMGIADLIERETERDPEDDVSMRACDLLPEEDREAIAWVREMGGVERCEAFVCQSTREHGYLLKIAEMLGTSIYGDPDNADALLEKLSGRLMPDGMEWLLEVWPKWSNGEYCKFGDWWTADKYGDYEPKQLRRLVFYTPEQLREWEQDEGDNFGYEWDFMRPSDTKYRPDKAEPPAPKVLDADGVEIREGDTVYHVKDGSEMTVYGIEGEWLVVSVGGRVRHDIVTHRAPVLAADGRPLREGEHVHHVETGAELVVKELPKPGEYQAVVVFAPPASHPTSFDPDRLTHEQPETWERLEEEARQLDIDLNDTTDDYPRMSFCRDLVRRCRALAERGE